MLEGAQLTINDAIAAGQAGMQRAADSAERQDPEFSAKAAEAMLAYLRAAPLQQASGEDMVDAALAAGVTPPNSRSFGGVVRSLSSRGVIRSVGLTLRRKGHGTAGARIWSLV
jgi:hypothetical protein